MFNKWLQGANNAPLTADAKYSKSCWKRKRPWQSTGTTFPNAIFACRRKLLISYPPIWRQKVCSNVSGSTPSIPIRSPTDGKDVNPRCLCHRDRRPIIGIHRAVSNEGSTFISFPYTQFHSFTLSLVHLSVTCTFSPFNNQTPCSGKTTAVETRNQQISLHW